MLSGFEYILAGLAALAAGAVNALAGGGTLITFPMLTFLGVPGHRGQCHQHCCTLSRLFWWDAGAVE